MDGFLNKKLKEHTNDFACFSLFKTNHIIFTSQLLCFRFLDVLFYLPGNNWFPFISLQYEHQLATSVVVKSIHDNAVQEQIHLKCLHCVYMPITHTCRLDVY